MDNSIYITLSRQLALFRDMDVTAGNIANANTTAYNAEHIMFTSYLTKDVNQGERNPMSFAHDISSYRSTENGSIKATGNPLDVALQGPGYFAVQTPLGVRYTRAGNFQVSSEGIITTPEGYPALDISNQPITLPEDATTIDVGEIGNIKVNDEDFATLQVVEFDNDQLLERLSSGLYTTDALPRALETPRVLQGALEGSNVQPVSELTHMIELSRSVGNTARFIEVMYDLQRKAANTWAQQA